MAKAKQKNTKKATKKPYLRNFQVRRINNGYIFAPLSRDSWSGQLKPVVTQERYAKDRKALAGVIETGI